MMTETREPIPAFDVTGVTADREYVPLLADVPTREGACNMAQDYSSLAWSAVLVKNARTGQVTDTYVHGNREAER